MGVLWEGVVVGVVRAPWRPGCPPPGSSPGQALALSRRAGEGTDVVCVRCRGEFRASPACYARVPFAERRIGLVP